MAVLIGMSGDVKGHKIEVTQEVTIGRHSDNDIVLEDFSVSGKHCAVVREGEKYTLRDFGSTNGTRVNGLPVKREIQLKPKDIIQVGAAEIMFDGQNVDVPDEKRASAQIEVTNEPSSVPDSFRSVSPFGPRRRESPRVWAIIMAVLGVLVIVMLGLFLFKLFFQ